jgi:putative aldouronate transport system substrate-binding protein
MNMRRKGILLTVLFALTFSFLGGCQKKTEAADSPPPGAYGERNEGKNYWMVKFPEPVTLHIVNRDYPQGTGKYLPGDDITKNGWTRALQRDLNVNIVTDWVSSQTDYDTKLNLAIVSGDLPDVFRVNAAQFKQLFEADMLADLTDYIENNINNKIKEFMEFSPEVVESAKKDGRLYAMPVFGYGIIGHPILLWLRYDWMQGKEAPRTIAEFEELIKTFMKDHPGTYGIEMDRYLGPIYSLGPGFKVYPGAWYHDSNGSVIYGSIQPEMKEMLSTLADWYKKGYMLKDFMSMDVNAVRQDTVSGKVGINFFQQWHGWDRGMDMVKNLGPESYMSPYDIPTIDGTPPVYLMGFDNEGYLVVNKNCKNIDAVCKTWAYISYIIDEAVAQGEMTEEARKEEFQTIVDEDSHIWFPFQVRNPIGEVKAYLRTVEIKRTEGKIRPDDPELSDEGWEDLLKHYNFDTRTGDPGMFGRWMQTWASPCAYDVDYKILDEGRYKISAIKGTLPDEVTAYGSTLGDMLIEGFTQIIIGAKPLSYFDELVIGWRSSGGDTMLDAMNREYGKK